LTSISPDIVPLAPSAELTSISGFVPKLSASRVAKKIKECVAKAVK
jgi:hypothetical protein